MFRLLLEPYCELCGKELGYSDLLVGICRNCVDEVNFIDLSKACTRCSLPEVGENCTYCKGVHFAFERNFSLFDYKSSIKDVFFRVKFDGDKTKIKVFHRLLRKLDLEKILGVKVDFIVPVPSSLLACLKRGFNLVNEVFKPVSGEWGVDFLEVLGRRFFYKSQKKLSKSERREKVAKQFFVKERVDLSGKVVLLVDDVFTTGSTLDVCAKLVSSLGALKVYSLTLFRANLV